MSAATPTSARVCVVIVAYNSGPHLQHAIDALSGQTFQDFELIVWDNASPDDAARIARLPANARLVISETNLGFAGGNNAAAALSTAPYLVLLNPDAFPEPNWLERLVAAADARPNAGSIGSVQVDAADPGRLDGLGDVYHISGLPYRGGCGAPKPERLDSGSIFGPCAAAALYRRAAFDAVGGFDARFFCYCEDVDLAFRLRRAGWSSWLEAGAIVRHVGSASTGRRSWFSVYHGSRNRLWTLIKNMPGPLLPIALPFHAAAVLILLVGGLIRRSGVARATLSGVWDAIKGAGPFWRERRPASASLASIAGAMTWSPLKLARRAPDVRPDVEPDAKLDARPDVKFGG